ncbi:MAG: FtsX-like permease family protein [Acidobacteria bacterium]|nr:FtsX-like permease family protein [Acidobacteriota bacterium]
MRVPPLTRKLLRDLLEMKGQALAIAMVVAAGVAMAVMYLSNFDSLRRTQQAYYERQRFGDVFASLKRAPLRLREDIAAIPGVTAVETRVVASVTLDVPGMDEPATGHLVSIPEDRRPQVNDVFLRGGRWVEPLRPDEVLASEAFVQAHGFTTGSRVRAVLNGRLRELTIVGIALSPEHVYNIPPGELVPDDRRYGVFWMGERALAAAFDMEGGFNDVSLLLAPTASTGEVMARIDGLLEPYGGLGAIPRALQISHWTLENELAQLQSFGFIVPMIFLMVAAFVLNVALARALALQRPQIAALKALGYGNGAIAWHYLQWAMLIALAGVAIGIAGGWWLGSALIGLYNQYFHFPILLYRMSGGVLVGVTVLTVLSAVLGAASAVRRAVRIPPAEAMRPEPPAVYRRSLIETPLLAPHFGTTGRMVLRNITRQPLRAGASVLGISMAVAVLMVGFVFIDAMDALITTQFSVAERQDVTVAFVEPRSASSRHALSRLPGVLAVEPIRTVPVRLRAGHRHRTLALTGAQPGARLRRIVDMDGRTIAVPASGLLLSSRLGQVLDVAPGDDVTVEVLEGARPVRLVRVSALVDDTFGLSAYMDLDALHDLMREGDVLSGAALLVDAADTALPGRLKETPAVAGATFKATVLRSFRETMAANLNLTMFLNVIFAGVIAFGVVYNAARVSLSERSRELASLRVLGFTRAEISLILLGELALLTLASLPVGAVVGYAFAAAIVGSLDSEVYRFPLVVGRQSVAWAWLAIMGAALASGLIVRRQLDGLDLVAVLKVRE